MTRPLDSVKFWWSGVGVHLGQITAKKKDFESLAELREFYLCTWAPESTDLKLDDITLERCTYGFRKIPVHELINRDSDTYQFDNIAKLMLGSQTVAEIWQLPGRPSLAKSSSNPIVYFPKDDTFLPEEYRVVHISENQLLDSLQIDDCTGLAQDMNPIHVEVSDCGYWLILVKSSQDYKNLWNFCLDRNKYVEDILEVKTPPPLRLEQRLLGEQYLQLDCDERHQKLEKIASYLEFLATARRAGDFPQGVLEDAIENRSQLSVTALPLRQEFDEFFSNNCDIEHVSETLQILLDHSINVFARFGWCAFALSAIQKECIWKRMTDKRIVKMLMFAPELVGLLAVQEGFPYQETLANHRCEWIRDRLRGLSFLYQPNGDVEISCPTSIPIFREYMKLKSIGPEGASLEHDRKEAGFTKKRPLEFSFRSIPKLMDPFGFMHKVKTVRIKAHPYCRIVASCEPSIPNEPPLFGSKAYRQGINEAIEAPELFLSESLGKRLDVLFKRALQECAPFHC